MDIRQYLKYYIGQPCVNYRTVYGADIKTIHNSQILAGYDITPIVRHLSSITEAELIGFIRVEKTYLNIKSANVYTFQGITSINYSCIIPQNQVAGEIGSGMSLTIHTPKQFHYLVSLGFWLFGNEAFDSGAVIDSNTIHP